MYLSEKIENHISLCLPPLHPAQQCNDLNFLSQTTLRSTQPLFFLFALLLLSLDAVIVAGLLALTSHFRIACRLRREGRSNGTAILRRSSTTPFNNNNNQLVTNASSHTASIDASLAAMDEANDPLPHQPSAAFSHPDSTFSKYSREELLEIGRAALHHLPPVNDLLMDGFHPDGHVNGNSSRGWGKANDANVHNDPNICWSGEQNWSPLGLQALSDEERHVSPSDTQTLYLI